MPSMCMNKNINAIGKHVLEAFIQWHCPSGIFNMLYNCKVLAVLIHLTGVVSVEPFGDDSR